MGIRSKIIREMSWRRRTVKDGQRRLGKTLALWPYALLPESWMCFTPWQQGLCRWNKATSQLILSHRATLRHWVTRKPFIPPLLPERGYRWEGRSGASGTRASLIAQLVKNLPAMQETLVQFLGQEDPLEKGSATHSSILGLPLWLSW